MNNSFLKKKEKNHSGNDEQLLRGSFGAVFFSAGLTCIPIVVAVAVKFNFIGFKAKVDSHFGSVEPKFHGDGERNCNVSSH